VNNISCIKINMVLQKKLFFMQVPRFHNNIPGGMKQASKLWEWL